MTCKIRKDAERAIKMMNTEVADNVEVVAVAPALAPRARPSHNFKWDDETDLLFLKAVQANKAFIRSSEKLETKWLRVIADLGKRDAFLSQGFTGKAGSLTMKLKGIFVEYEAKYASRNLSARPETDDLSPADSVLFGMREQILKLGEEVHKEKDTKTQKKKCITDITDAVSKGGAKAKENLFNVASNLKSGDEEMLSVSVSNFVKMVAFTAVTPAPCSSQPAKRRRPIESVESDDIALMTVFSARIQRDKEAAQDKFSTLENCSLIQCVPYIRTV